MVTNSNEVKKVRVKLSNIGDANELNRVASQTRFDVEVRSLNGRYVVDAKSLMGLFSLDLSNELELVMASDNDEEIGAFEHQIAKFILKH